MLSPYGKSASARHLPDPREPCPAERGDREVPRVGPGSEDGDLRLLGRLRRERPEYPQDRLLCDLPEADCEDDGPRLHQADAEGCRTDAGDGRVQGLRGLDEVLLPNGHEAVLQVASR